MRLPSLSACSSCTLIPASTIPVRTPAAPLPAAQVTQAPAQPALETISGPLSLDGHVPLLGISLQAISSTLKPGDAVFEYRPFDKTPRQHLIGIGQQLARLKVQKRLNPYVLNPHVVHVCIVVGVDTRGHIWVADASQGGLRNFCLSFDPSQPTAVDPKSYYLVYRFADPFLNDPHRVPTLAQLAQSWADGTHANFSTFKALWSPIQLLSPASQWGRKAQRCLWHILQYAYPPQTIQARRSSGLFKMMCSEFVAYTYLSAHLLSHHRTLFQQTLFHPLSAHALSLEQQKALCQEASQLLECYDPKALPPALLHALLIKHQALNAVGYLRLGV